MRKDISEYIDKDTLPKKVKKLEGGLQNLVGRNFTVLSWKMRKSRWRDEPYYVIYINVDGESYYVNAGNEYVIQEIQTIQQKKTDNGETDMSFDVTAVNTEFGVILYSSKWE